jgi:hypothetical protein
MNFHFAQGYPELQPYQFADRYLDPQHHRKPGFADVNRVSSNYRRITRVDGNIDFQPVAGMAASFHEIGRRYRIQNQDGAR